MVTSCPRHEPQPVPARYNQPPHPSFYLGDVMKMPPRPRIITTPVKP
jgi:hypothetical protein